MSGTIDSELARLRLMCDVGIALDHGPDQYAGVAKAARLCVPGFCDWCAIDVHNDDHSRQRIASAGDPSTGEECDAFQRLSPGNLLTHADSLSSDEFLGGNPDGNSCVLLAPMVVHSRIVGAVTFTRFSGNFTSDDRVIAQDVARRFALAVDHRRMSREMQELRHQAEALQDVGLILAGELDRDRIMHEVADAGADITGARFAAFVPHPLADSACEPGAVIGITRDRFVAALTPRARDLLEPTLRLGAALCLSDLSTDPRASGPIVADGVVVRSFLAIPVVSRAREVVGGLFFAHEKPGVFTPRHATIVGGIAAQAASALDSARLFEAERSARAAFEQAVASLELNDERLQLALRAGRMGIWHWDVAADRVTCSDQVERIFALHNGAPMTRAGFLGLVHEEDRAATIADFERALQMRGEFHAEFRVRTGETTRWVVHKGQVFCDGAGTPLRLSGVCMDVTTRKKFEQALADQAQQLIESNAELEQFAFISSHDLQEPLRMVTSYLALLQRRYGEQLDDKARGYITFAVDGAQRMMALITDLLAYSRAGRTRERPLVAVSSELAVIEAIGNLRPAIADSDAMITHHDLPPVRAQHRQLVQLFQNLIGNALKFRGSAPPLVDIGAVRHESGEWCFQVRDNGIGIASEHFQRIFDVFQRLHARGEYAGTGIGLAICKKIVERLDGRILVESKAGTGSTFSFSISD